MEQSLLSWWLRSFPSSVNVSATILLVQHSCCCLQRFIMLCCASAGWASEHSGPAGAPEAPEESGGTGAEPAVFMGAARQEGRSSTREHQGKAPGARHALLCEMSFYCRNMAALSPRHCLPLPLICVCSPKKELVEQITAGSVELDLEKLKVRPTRRL